MNIVEYVESQLHTFEEVPFGEVDSLVLSQFSYINLPTSETLLIKDLFRREWFDTMFDENSKPENKDLLFALASSPRFRDIQISNYVNELSKEDQSQFSAVTLQLDPETIYVAYRGTDGTFIGWKEDFNLSYQNEVPAQKYALIYLESVANDYRLYIGGHSKGGNLAMYAAAMASGKVQDQIITIYSHDGPGFRKEVFSQSGFQKIASRVRKSVPEDSIIGMLMESHEKMRIVKSTKRSFGAHDPYSWVIEDGLFVEAEQLSGEAQVMNESITDWLETLPDTERQAIIDRLYEVVNKDNMTSLAEFQNNWMENISQVWKGLTNMAPEEKEAVTTVFGNLVQRIWNNSWKREEKENRDVSKNETL